MKLKIDIEKSIEKERLYPKSKLSCYSDYFIYGFFALAFLCFIIGMLNDSNFHINPGMIIGILIYVIASSLTFYLLNKMNKLTVFNIKDKTKAKQFIHSLESEIDWEIQIEENETIIFQTNPKFCNERQVTFIFRNGNIHINVMSFGRFGMSPIYYYSDKEMLETIIDKLKENKIIQFNAI
jgi:hypothetical protein